MRQGLVMGLALALACGYGVFLVYTAAVYRWSGVGVSPRVSGAIPDPQRLRDWMTQAGLGGISLRQLAGAMLMLFGLGAATAFVIFGAPAPAAVAGGLTAAFPLASYRARRETRRAEARESWPRMIEEVRLLTGSAGRSVPQALFDVGRRGPAEFRAAFAASQREWMISTDFARACATLKARLADPTADAACETLLIAHEMGGTDLDRRLSALIEDRIQDLQGRKDARSRQAGVRFARRFVLLVPAGMALAGLSIGAGRSAYETPLGQVAVVFALAVTAGCWLWAGRLLRLPEEERVFYA